MSVRVAEQQNPEHSADSQEPAVLPQGTQQSPKSDFQAGAEIDFTLNQIGVKYGFIEAFREFMI